MLQPTRSLSLLAALLCSAALTACGGHPPLPGDDQGDGGTDASAVGQQCQFDSDCVPGPPNYICGQAGLCEQGCTLNPACPSGQFCNIGSGRCVVSTAADGGSDAGPDAGTGSDGGVGTPSDTLCKACNPGSGNSDCHAGGECVQDSSHSSYFCTQDCTTASCPGGYVCLADRTGSQHQCYPLSGSCSSATGTPDAGVDAGPINDPRVPSNNPNGCGFCGKCNVNDDCFSGSICVNGTCATGPCTSLLDCLEHHGGYQANCSDIGLANKYCVPFLGQCISFTGVLGVLNGDAACEPSGTNSGCAAAAIPSPSLGVNVAVSASFSPKPQITYGDALAIDSHGNLAHAYIGLDSGNNSFVGFSQSTTGGASWVQKPKAQSSAPKQSDPSLAVSKWVDGSSVAHERVHAVWVAYSSSSSGAPTNMVVEAAFSDDGGATWGASAKVTTAADTNSGALSIDRPQIAVSGDAAQTLMVTFAIGSSAAQHVYSAVSKDHGATWLAKVPIEKLADNKGHDLVAAAFDPTDATGSTVYAIFAAYTGVNAATGNSIDLVRSADRGNTWSGPLTVSAADDQVLLDPPSLAIDASHHLYVGYTAAPAGNSATFWDARVASVDVSLATPAVTHRARVSDDQANCFQHFHTQVAVNRATGALYAGFLDNRNGGKGATWYAISSDGGATFAANRRVSDAEFDFTPDPQQAGLKFLGDFFGFLFDGTRLRVAWSDPRDGTSSQAFYAGGAP